MGFAQKAVGVAGAVVLLAAANAAGATSLTFTFDKVGNINALGNNATNAQIQTYMNAVLAAYGYGTIAVTGAKASNSYTGEGYVVGTQNLPNGTVTPRTLANTDGGVYHANPKDTFIMNNNPIDRIVMTFSGLDIYSVKFDLQIFPDGTCPNPTSGNANTNKGCTSTSSAHWPDFKFEADDTLEQTWLGVLPSAGPYLYSPNHKNVGNGETAPQLLTTSGLIEVDDVHKLEFIDWPATIGIDNLTIEFGRIPEPATLGVMALGLAGLGFARRWKSISA